nr:MAG TPA: hypothetical protein [Caudoviricetes sp.]
MIASPRSSRGYTPLSALSSTRRTTTPTREDVSARPLIVQKSSYSSRGAR